MLRVDVFAGEQPAVSARLLDNPQATVSKNCLLTNGDLRAFEGALPVAVQPPLAASSNTLYLYGSNWFSWDGTVNAVSSPVRQDPYDRVYFTGLDCPRYTRNDIANGAGVKPSVSYKLGVPAPDVPVLEYTAPSENTDLLDDETRFYLCTYITTTGEESKPSPVSEKLVVQAPLTDVVTVNLPSPFVNEQDISQVRIYRSATGGDDAGFFSVGTVAVGTISFDDDPTVVSLGATLATESYDLPPTDMHSLIKLSGGFLIGASGQTVCPSEAYLPYAYKTENQQVANAPIVAMAAIPNGAVVATEGYPELLTGFSPDTISLSRLELEQSCVSARSMVDMGDIAIYVSPDGLVGVNVSGASLLTENIIERVQWQALNPQSMHGCHHEGKYIGFYDGVGGFVFDPRRKDFIFLDFYASATYRDLAGDKLYLLIDDALHEWRAGEKLLATWRSKEFRTPPGGFVFFRVKHGPGEILTNTVVSVITEDGLLHSETLEINDWGYLPPGLFESWQIEVQSSANIESVMLGNDLAELGV